MNNVNEQYRIVYENLKEMNNKRNSETAKHDNTLAKYSEENAQLDARRSEEIDKLRDCEKRINAYVRIAEAHARELIKGTERREFNLKILAALAVKINNARQYDRFAELLYTEATSQLLDIQYKINNDSAEARKKQIEDESTKSKRMYTASMGKYNEELFDYVNSNEFEQFILSVKESVLPENIDSSDLNVYIGSRKAYLPAESSIPRGILADKLGFLYDKETSEVLLPYSYDFSTGSGLFIEYSADTEPQTISGIHNMLLNIVQYHDDFEQIIYADPSRMNNNALGILAPLSYMNNTNVSPVATSNEMLKRQIESVLAALSSEDKQVMTGVRNSFPRRILVFNNFPEGYDSQVVSHIQRFFVNAKYYNMTIIATHNNAKQSHSITEEVLNSVKRNANCIRFENGFKIEDNNGVSDFVWFDAPLELPEEVKEKFIRKASNQDKSNDYTTRVGLKLPADIKKGTRMLTDIPFGVDENGKILKMDFEDSNFASFICGASRSGKSTLLHTLITGVIKNNHPDDVEVWLVDFKMTEFSRYIEHCPPHVRYIILDESPELVYDLIDRLTEILVKRQNAFKGKWQKLKEVPKERYMPAMLIIIDEFSVMSNVVADSVMSGRENYAVKLQTLLAKGAALGMHFIFASQGFTTGTRGLNDFAKKQVQQRVAMKSEFNEIKETLDLKSASDEDRALMEQLPVHHALLRIPVDARGNHLSLSKVLYIPDMTEQDEMIEEAKRKFKVAPKYDVNDASIYIDKKTMVVDGSSYSAFDTRAGEMKAFIDNKATGNDEEITMFLGEPRRMLPIYPVSFRKSFCENMLVVSPVSENMISASVIESVLSSLQMDGLKADLWTTSNNGVYRILEGCSVGFKKSAVELDAVCDEIRKIKARILNKVESNKVIVILGAETLIGDMEFQGTDNPSAPRKSEFTLSASFEKRNDNEFDLLSQMEAGFKPAETTNDGFKFHLAAEEKNNNYTVEETGAYDAREDLKYILTHGPKMGYHFILVFNTVGELNQSKINIGLFRHKVAFKMSKMDAMGLLGSAGANGVPELTDHSFRYSDGIESLSFRPYLHPGLSWDGWGIHDDESESEDFEEEYLM